MNAYYRTWDALSDEAKASDAAGRAQALYANGDIDGAVAELGSVRTPVDMTAVWAKIEKQMTPVDQMPGARSAERHAYSPSKIARRRR